MFSHFEARIFGQRSPHPERFWHTARASPPPVRPPPHSPKGRRACNDHQTSHPLPLPLPLLPLLPLPLLLLPLPLFFSSLSPSSSPSFPSSPSPFPSFPFTCFGKRIGGRRRKGEGVLASDGRTQGVLGTPRVTPSFPLLPFLSLLPLLLLSLLPLRLGCARGDARAWGCSRQLPNGYQYTPSILRESRNTPEAFQTHS